MGTCCAGCTCGDPMHNPAATVVDQEIVDVEIVDADPSAVTEGWQMTGLASGRDQLGHRRRDVPILRPIEGPVEWSASELHLGIRVIELCIDAEDAGDAYVKVLGVDALSVYSTWQRAAATVGTADWLEVSF